MAEVEYAAAFGGGQVLVELTLTLTNLGHPQQLPPLALTTTIARVLAYQHFGLSEPKDVSHLFIGA